MVPLKEATGEHHIYWCRVCGAVLERLSMGMWEMVPAWSEERLKNKKVDYKFLPPKKEKVASRALGRGLKDIKIPQSTTLQRVLNGLDTKKAGGEREG